MRSFPMYDGDRAPRMLIPALGAVDDIHDEEHHRDLDQDADDGSECGAGMKTKQTDGCRDRELEEIRCTDQGRGTGDIVAFPTRRLSP